MIIGAVQDLLYIEENLEFLKTKSTLKVLGKLGAGFLYCWKT